MGIVNKLFEEHQDLSEDDLLNEIINISELTPEDLWLLPQYVFDDLIRISLATNHIKCKFTDSRISKHRIQKHLVCLNTHNQ